MHEINIILSGTKSSIRVKKEIPQEVSRRDPGLKLARCFKEGRKNLDSSSKPNTHDSNSYVEYMSKLDNEERAELRVVKISKDIS